MSRVGADLFFSQNVNEFLAYFSQGGKAGAVMKGIRFSVKQIVAVLKQGLY